MKQSLIVGITLLLGTPALALHYFDCSNASSSVRIAEQEIWGANPRGCLYKGEKVEDGKVTLYKKTKKSIQLEGKRTPGGDWEETFVIQAKLSSKKGLPEPVTTQHKTEVETWLLCHEKSTSARDFAGGKFHCEVEYK